MDFRPSLVVTGALILGGTIGKAFDSAYITPDYDSDMFTLGIIAGLGLAMILLAFLRRRPPEQKADQPPSST